MPDGKKYGSILKWSGNPSVQAAPLKVATKDATRVVDEDYKGILVHAMTGNTVFYRLPDQAVEDQTLYEIDYRQLMTWPEYLEWLADQVPVMDPQQPPEMLAAAELQPSAESANA
ncbi:MAG: hypothetical protein HQ530_05850 [Parcubacteria group bacterium]|nr:hypothetical protein [Parcubacteria group bacterium]